MKKQVLLCLSLSKKGKAINVRKESNEVGMEQHRRKVGAALYQSVKGETASQMFRAGQGKRMNKKVKSHVDNGGTLGRVITTRRFSNSYIHVTCKTVNRW